MRPEGVELTGILKLPPAGVEFAWHELCIRLPVALIIIYFFCACCGKTFAGTSLPGFSVCHSCLDTSLMLIDIP